MTDEVLSRGAKFGWQVSAQDLDGDGKTELIITAPGQTANEWLEMSGAVYIFTQPFP